MKTFKDLVFEAHPNLGHIGGVQALMDFDNGFGVSVVKSNFTYGGDKGLYELAVFKDGHIHYDNSVANGDVAIKPAKAIAAKAVAQPRIRSWMPETKSKPAKIAAITEVVPRSRPAITKTMTIRNPGANNAKILKLNRPAISFLAKRRLAQRIIKNLANSLG